MAYESMNAARIGTQLRSLREKQNKSQNAVAEDLGISMSALCMYETGNRIPRDEIKIRIAEYFNVPVESIFFPTEQHET